MGELRRKYIRHEKLQKYWIVWKFIENVLRRDHIALENITESELIVN
jgi:hypothetical protein